MDKNQIWEAVLQRLAEKISRMEFYTWFKKVRLTKISGTAALISCPTEMNKNWLENKYSALVLLNLKNILPEIDRVFFSVDLSLADSPPVSPQVFEKDKVVRKLPNRPEVKLADGIESRILHSRFTLENFIVGSENQLAHAACLALSECERGHVDKYSPLFIYGGVGLGKTHLLQATGNEIIRRNPDAIVVYTTSERFMNEIVKYIKDRKTEEFRKKYRRIDALIIDDVQFFEGKEKTQEELFNTFNDLHEFKKHIIFSADRPPSQLTGISDRLRSRMGWGLSVDVQMPGYETRLAIIQRKSQEMNLFLPTDVQEFIATNVRRNLRELEQILQKILAELELSNISPTIQSVGKIFRKLNPDEELLSAEKGRSAVAKSTDDIITLVSEYFQIPATDLLSDSRKQEFVFPRQIAWLLCRDVLRMSLEFIGKDFGGKNHTTIMHGIKKIEELSRRDSATARHIHALKKDLGGK